MRPGASVVWHYSLLLMNSFNKTEAAVFSCRLCFLRAFPFTSLILLTQLVFSACVAAVKSRPVLHHCVVIFFWSSGIMECTCMLLKFEMESAHALGGVSGVTSFITTNEQLQYNRGCCFLVQAMIPEGFPFHQFNKHKSTPKQFSQTLVYLTYYLT